MISILLTFDNEVFHIQNRRQSQTSAFLHHKPDTRLIVKLFEKITSLFVTNIMAFLNFFNRENDIYPVVLVYPVVLSAKAHTFKEQTIQKLCFIG